MNKFKRFSVLLLLLLCTTACEGESSREVIETTFEDILGVDLPSNYLVVENVWSSNIDYSATYSIEFDADTFAEFVQQLDMKKWRSDYEGVYDFIEPVRKGVYIQMFPERKSLSYLYSR